jgi:anti-anti-sigma factor
LAREQLLGSVTFLSSTTLRVLLRLRRLIQEQGGSLCLRGLSDHVYEVFAVSPLGGHP